MLMLVVLFAKNLKVPVPAANGVALFNLNRISKEEYCVTLLS